MGKYFGTDGFRGEANVALTPLHAYTIGRFLGWYFGASKQRRARGVIGKDTRRSSYMLEYALAAGIAASGADAHLLHVTTTPSVAYVTRSEGFDFGVMISASHNPFSDNGIKLFGSGGEKMEEEVLSLCETYLDGGVEISHALGADIGRTVDYTSGRHRYVGHLVSLSPVSLSGYRIGLDLANGSTWQIGKEVFDALGAQVYTRGNTPNGVNINQNCGSTHMEGLQEMVKARHLDLGFALDGDGDRLICVDHTGEVVDGDGVLYLLATHLKAKGELKKNRVVGTVMTNGGLEKALLEEGISLIRTPVGDRYVYECMAKAGYSLGGEPSGHMIIAKYATTGDGILTALSVMRVMVETGKSLRELVSGYTPMPQAQIHLPIRHPADVMGLPTVQARLGELERRLGDRGRILVRASGTEEKIRILCEGADQDICQRFCLLAKEIFTDYV